MRTLLLSFLLVVLFPLLSLAEHSQRVVNGNDASEAEYPWMVALVDRDADPAIDLIFCGGTLIHEQYVLTAAHCLFDFFGSVVRARSTQVIIGRTTLSSDSGTRLPLSRVIVHPDYSDERFVPLSDLAVLRLSEPVEGEIVSLASSSEPEFTTADQEALILGWGVTDKDALDVYPDTLQEGTVDIIDDTSCRNTYGLIYNPDGMVCAAKLSTSVELQDGVDTCFGDSGGPLLTTAGGVTKQVGITSFGFRCEDTTFPGGYTEVPVFYDWITGLVSDGAEADSLLTRVETLVKRLSRSRRKKVGKGSRAVRNAQRTELSEALSRLRELSQQDPAYASLSFPQFTATNARKLSSRARAASSRNGDRASRLRARRATLVLIEKIRA